MITLTEKQQELRSLAASGAKHILAVGGSRSGKTFALCYFIDRRAWKAPGSRHLIYRKHAVAAKQSIGKDTLRKIHDLTGNPVPKWHEQDGYFSYPNGSEIWLAGLDASNVDKVLGKEYATVYANEASEFGFDVREQVLTRLAQKVSQVDGRQLSLREYVDLNPTTQSHWTYKMWFLGVNPANEQKVDASRYGAIFINPLDNLENLPPDVIETLEGMSERQRRRFLLGQYTSDADNGLWRRRMIRRVTELPGDMDRIVVAIDPAVSTEIGSDNTGIVVCGMQGQAGKRSGYVMEDASGKYRPEEWARIALNLYHDTNADCIVAEANQGGDMVESMIRAIEAQTDRRAPPARVKLVHATKGKAVRAEPIAGLYERGLIYHVGEFGALEDEMCSFTVDFDRKSQGYSPDRMDALVWGFTELFGQMAQRRPIQRATAQPKASFF